MTRINSLAIAAAAILTCYVGVIAGLAGVWATSHTYSYGFVIFLISLYMLWSKSAKLRAIQPVPDYELGIPVTFAGVVMLATGRLGLFTSLQQASLIVTVGGFVLLFAGREALRAIWFPIAYLLLGIPIWDGVIDRLQPPSQEFSAWMASEFLQIAGVPTFREGTRLVLPNVTLSVMRECSGVSQLFAIIAMALPASFLWLNRHVRRITLVALAVGIAYLSNGIRIALVGFLAYRGLGHGDLGMHIFEGLAVSLIGYALLFGCLSVLAKGDRVEGDPVVGDTTATSTSGISARRLRLQFATGILVFMVGVFLLLFHAADVELKRSLESFPTQIGDWTLDTKPVSMTGTFPAIDDELVRAYPSASGERHFIALDDELVRTYQNSRGQRVRLYIGYYRSQQTGKELAGDASHALSLVATPVKVQLESRTVELRQVERNLSTGARGVVYWYDLNGRVLSSRYVAKEYLLWDALTRRRTNGAVVMVAWESRTTAQTETSRTGARAFARAILPLLPKFIPS